VATIVSETAMPFSTASAIIVYNLILSKCIGNLLNRAR
jgi:hypothetical protein